MGNKILSRKSNALMSLFLDSNVLTLDIKCFSSEIPDIFNENKDVYSILISESHYSFIFIHDTSLLKFVIYSRVKKIQQMTKFSYFLVV